MQTSFPFSADNPFETLLELFDTTYGQSDAERRDPMRQLVFAIIAEGVAPSVGSAIFNRVLAKYRTWPGIVAAGEDALGALMIGLPNANGRARRVVAALLAVKERCGDYDLELLSKMATDQAQRWLEELPSVTQTAAASVLAYSALRRSVFVVDRDVAVVIRRLRLCPEGSPVSAMARLLAEAAPARWSSREFERFMAGLSRLSRDRCGALPRCDRCPLASSCPTAGRSATVVPFPGRRTAVNVPPARQKRPRTASV